MEASWYNQKARFIYQGQAFDAQSFCALKTDLQWLKYVQQVVDFWINSAEDMQVSTSGSTGTPKKIMLPRSVLSQSANATLQFFNLKENDKALLFLPCDYVAGKMMVIRTLLGGLQLNIAEPKLALPELKEKFDFVALTPMQAANSLSQLYHFRSVLLGGAPVPYALETRLQDVSAEVFHSYGMTETASHVALRKINGSNASNRFLGLHGVTFSQDARQCLIVDAPLWKAYNLATNDVVELIEKNQFIWKGRADNIINSGGIKIFPEEIEKTLAPQINQPFFLGSLADSQSGEKLVLFVEGEPLSSIDLSVLKKQHQPKEIHFLPAFVYTETDKINRQKTLQNFLSMHSKG